MDGVYHPPSGRTTPVRHRSLADLGTVGPPAGAVDVWAATSADAVPEIPLPADEAARAARFKHPAAREQFARTRRLLRAVLGGYLSERPQVVRLTYTPDGKPALADRPGLWFNVSHTGGLSVVAAADVPVGVDAEGRRPMPSAAALVERFFAPAERAQYLGLPEDLRPAGFFRGWTLKEAVLKGVGCGSRGLAGCAVDLDPRRPAVVVELTGPAAALGPGWAVGCWAPADGYAAALAVLTGG